jgi:type II secretory pathway component GspD/PulD (secretin)
MLACSVAVLAQGERGTEKNNDPRISVRFTKEDVSKVIEVFGLYSGTTIDLDPLYAHRRIDLALDNASLEAALKEVAAKLGAKVGRLPAGGFRIVPPWKAAFFEKLQNRKIAIDHPAPLPIASILSGVAKRAGVPAVLDPALRTNRTGELHVKDVTAAQALDLLTAPNELGWDLRYGVVFIATPARLKALPAVAAFASAALPKRSVKLACVDASLSEGLRQLQAAGGPTITIDLEAVKAVEAAKVTCAVKGLANYHALALMLLPHGLSAIVEEGGRIRVIPR